MGNNRWELDQLHLTTHFSISRTATLILTTKKTKHFLFLKCLKKCNFYFKMLLKCFEIDSKCNAMLGMIKSTFELKNKTCRITLGVEL